MLFRDQYVRLSDTGQMCLCAWDTQACANENKPRLKPSHQKQPSANVMIFVKF